MLTEEEKREVERRALAWTYFGYEQLSKPSPPELARLYAFEFSNGTVKIGISRDIQNRMVNLKSGSGLEITRFHHSDLAPKDFMLGLESTCHKTFAEYQTRGEFFNIAFEDACAEIDKYAEQIAAAFKAAEQKYLDRLEYFFEFEKTYFESNPELPKPNDEPPPPAPADNWLEQLFYQCENAAHFERILDKIIIIAR